jgi:HSP20 family protein
VNVYFATARQEKEWEPAVDVYRATWGWLLKFDLAGVRLEDVHVHVSKKAVTVSGVRRDYMLEDGCTYYSMEIQYSRFERTVHLPDDVHPEHLRMDYRDGILMVRIGTSSQFKGGAEKE